MKDFIYELNYISSNDGTIKTNYFNSKFELDSFVFSNDDVISIYIYNYSTHNYEYVGNFNELFDILKINIGLKILEKLLKEECD